VLTPFTEVGSFLADSVKASSLLPSWSKNCRSASANSILAGSTGLPSNNTLPCSSIPYLLLSGIDVPVLASGAGTGSGVYSGV
jgi:hypothetical protein